MRTVSLSHFVFTYNQKQTKSLFQSLFKALKRNVSRSHIDMLVYIYIIYIWTLKSDFEI